MRSPLRRCLAATAFVATLALASSGSAQQQPEPIDPSRDREARSLFEAGRAAFDDGRYEDALGYFQRSYDLSHRPALLYNIGTTNDRLRRSEDAITAFESYLVDVPHAANRREVEARIRMLRQEVEQAASARPEQAPTPEQTARASEGASAAPLGETGAADRDDDDGGVLGQWWFWTIIGAAVAGGVIAAVLLSSSNETEQPIGGDDGWIVMALR